MGCIGYGESARPLKPLSTQRHIHDSSILGAQRLIRMPRSSAAGAHGRHSGNREEAIFKGELFFQGLVRVLKFWPSISQIRVLRACAIPPIIHFFELAAALLMPFFVSPVSNFMNGLTPSIPSAYILEDVIVGANKVNRRLDIVRWTPHHLSLRMVLLRSGFYEVKLPDIVHITEVLEIYSVLLVLQKRSLQ